MKTKKFAKQLFIFFIFCYILFVLGFTVFICRQNGIDLNKLRGKEQILMPNIIIYPAEKDTSLRIY